MALSLLAFTGCAQSGEKEPAGGSADTATVATAEEQDESAAAPGAASVSVQEETKEAEPVEEPALDPSEVSGYWVLGGAKDVEDGILTAYWFDDQGAFVMKSNILGATFDREGTYRIEGDKVYVNVPAAEDGTNEVGGTKVDIEVKEIKDGEVAIDGDKLTTTAISPDGKMITADRVSDEQYQEYFDQVSALGPKDIAVGETVSTPTATLTIDSLSFVGEIYPSDTSGYYSYLADEEGKTYLLAMATFTNEGTEYCSPGYSTEVTFNVGENTYNGEIEVDGGSRFSKTYSVEAKETSVLYIYCSVPDAALDSGDVKMTWEVPSEQEYMNTYWKSSFPHDTFVVAM